MAMLALALLGLWLAPGPASAQLSEPASLLDTQADPAVPAVPVDTPTDPVTPAVPADPVDTPTDPVTPDPGQTLPLDPSVDGPATPAPAPPSGSVAPVLPEPPSSLQESQLTVFPSPVGPPRPVSSPPGGAAAGVHATPLGKAASFGDAIGAAYPPPRTLAALPSAAMGDMHPAADAPAAPPNGRRPAPEPPRSPQAPGGPSVGGGSSSGGFSSGIFFAALIALMSLAAPRMSRLSEAAARLRPQAYFVLLERPG